MGPGKESLPLSAGGGAPPRAGGVPPRPLLVYILPIVWTLDRRDRMRSYTAVIERDPDTVVYVGHVPGFPGARSQGETLEELKANLTEVVAMLLEDGEPPLQSEFIGTQTIRVA